jgi:hypothetical protein
MISQSNTWRQIQTVGARGKTERTPIGLRQDGAGEPQR